VVRLFLKWLALGNSVQDARLWIVIARLSDQRCLRRWFCWSFLQFAAKFFFCWHWLGADDIGSVRQVGFYTQFFCGHVRPWYLGCLLCWSGHVEYWQYGVCDAFGFGILCAAVWLLRRHGFCSRILSVKKNCRNAVGYKFVVAFNSARLVGTAIAADIWSHLDRNRAGYFNDSIVLVFYSVIVLLCKSV